LIREGPTAPADVVRAQHQERYQPVSQKLPIHYYATEYKNIAINEIRTIKNSPLGGKIERLHT